MAKKAKRKSTTGKAKAKNASKRPVKKAAPKRSAKKAAKAKKAPKSPARERTRAKMTKAAKTKNAARAAASRREAKAPAPKTPTALETAGKIARGVGAVAVAAVANRLPWTKNDDDPIALLEADHRQFEALFKEGADTTERAVKGRTEVLNKLTKGLTVHEAIEEKILYPALEPHAEAHDLVLESFQEHHVADILIKELHQLKKDDEKWGAKFKVLQENIEHHITEEERKMFPVARGVLAREELLALGARMRALKADLVK